MVVFGCQASCQSWFRVLIVGMITLLFTCVVALRKAFKPIDQRKPPQGKQWKLPPGPSRSPIVGNLLQFLKARRNSSQLYAYLLSLSSYGEMTSLQMGSQTWVLLNSSRVTTEIIAKRGNITTERPYLPIASGLVSRDKRTVLRQTAQWAEGRRVMHHLLNGSALKTYGNWQETESVQLLAAYLCRPQRWYSHHYRYANSVVHRIVFGERLLKSTPELVDFQRAGVEFVRSINASVIDFFPQLARLPKVFQPWRKHWEVMGQFHYDVFQTWWKPIKQAIANGTAPPSFVRDALFHKDTKYTGDDEDAMYLATSIIAAGSDNTRMTLNTFVMAALCHPKILQKARDEVDRICGSNAQRLPDLVDMVKMPYISAMIKEILRWRPVVPFVPQHQLTQHLEFEGYHFPKGTNFVINSIAVCQDVEEPDVFRPERWLDDNESSITHGLWQFGGGRRVCVGYRVAQQGLFIALARLAYCFNYAPNGPYDSKNLRHFVTAEPFPVKVTVRSMEHEQLITNEATRLGFT